MISFMQPPVCLQSAKIAFRMSFSEKRDHLVPVRTAGGKTPLFFILPGPPGSFEFIDLLPEDQPVYDLYFIRFFGTESFPSVEEIALIFLNELRTVQPHGPYQLCGYSKAGLVAYEMARVLLSQGEDVSFLALIETWHPKFEKNLTRNEYLRFRFLYFVDRFAKYGRKLVQGNLLGIASETSAQLIKKAKLLGWRIIRQYFGGQGQPIPQAMQQAESIVVLRSFAPKPLSKRFMLIRTNNPFERKLSDPTLGWDICATEGVEVQFVSGDPDHGTIVTKPHVCDVIGKIAPHLSA